MSEGEEKEYKIELRAKEEISQEAERKLLNEIEENFPEAKVNDVKKEVDPSFIAIVIGGIDLAINIYNLIKNKKDGLDIDMDINVGISPISNHTQTQDSEGDTIDLDECQNIELDRWIDESKIDIIYKNDKRRVISFPVLMPPVTDKNGNRIPFYQVRETIWELYPNLVGKELKPARIPTKGKLLHSWTLKDNREYKNSEGKLVEYPKGTWVVEIWLDEETWDQLDVQELGKIFVIFLGTLFEANLNNNSI